MVISAIGFSIAIHNDVIGNFESDHNANKQTTRALEEISVKEKPQSGNHSRRLHRIMENRTTVFIHCSYSNKMICTIKVSDTRVESHIAFSGTRFIENIL